jgi:hypothetical protein
MNFQEKVIESTAGLRTRATAIANAALVTARSQAAQAARRVDSLKGSLASLQVAGRALNTVARRHGSRFVKENSAIALDAAKDVSALARATYSQLAKPESAGTRKRQKPAVRKRASSKAG